MSINLEGTCESNMKDCARNKKDTKIFVGKRRAKLKCKSVPLQVQARGAQRVPGS